MCLWVWRRIDHLSPDLEAGLPEGPGNKGLCHTLVNAHGTILSPFRFVLLFSDLVSIATKHGPTGEVLDPAVKKGTQQIKDWLWIAYV